MLLPSPISPLFPYTTLFRSGHLLRALPQCRRSMLFDQGEKIPEVGKKHGAGFSLLDRTRSEEHTSELQSLRHLVCRLLLEKKKQQKNKRTSYQTQQQVTQAT